MNSTFFRASTSAVGERSRTTLRRTSSLYHRGGVLVCVMVVLLIVGLLGKQTIQTLLMIRRADHQRGQILQTRALLDLGRLAVATGQIPESQRLVIDVEGRQGTVAFTQLSDLESSEPSLPRDEVPSPSAASPIRYRIVATYSAGETNEVTASWESPR